MAGPFDADDFMRRSFFNSIIGYKGCKKAASFQPATRQPPVLNHGSVSQLVANCRNSASAAAIPLIAQQQPQQTASFSAPSSVTLTDTYVAGDAIVTEDIVVAPLPLERTELDIYREIVCECAEIERQHSPNGTDCSSPQSPQLCQHCHCGKAKREAEVAPTPSPPLPSGATVSLEDFVKLVVTAVRESGVLAMSPKSVDCNANVASETPEAILQRKRQQNNEAAARYRKRQRAARDVADCELHELEEKNKELKETVARMQEEIDRLKVAVLGGGRETDTPQDSCLS